MCTDGRVSRSAKRKQPESTAAWYSQELQASLDHTVWLCLRKPMKINSNDKNILGINNRSVCVWGGKVPINNLRNVWSSWLYRSWVWTDRPPTQVRQQRIIKISKLIYQFSVISKIPSSFSIKTTWQLRLYEKTKTKNTLRGKKTFKMNVLCGKGTTPGLDLHSTWQSDHWLLVRRSGSIPSTHTGGLTQLKLQGI